MNNFRYLVKNELGIIAGFNEVKVAESYAKAIGGVIEQFSYCKIIGTLKLNKTSGWLDGEFLGLALMKAASEQAGYDLGKDLDLGWVEIVIYPAQEPEETGEDIRRE